MIRRLCSWWWSYLQLLRVLANPERHDPQLARIIRQIREHRCPAGRTSNVWLNTTYGVDDDTFKGVAKDALNALREYRSDTDTVPRCERGLPCLCTFHDDVCPHRVSA